jgi:hypothetical protein
MMAALVAAVVAAAGCGGNPEADPSASATARVIDPTVSPTAAGPSPTGSAAPDPDGGQTSAPTTDPEPTESPTGEPNPNPQGVDPEPIPTGRYAYATNGWSQLGGGAREDLPSTTWLVAAAPSDNRQNVTRDMRDSDGYGQTVRRLMEYDSGFLLHEIESTAKVRVLVDDVTDRRTLKASPPGALGAPDSDVGWSNSFTMSGDGVTAKITAKLVRFEDVTVGGQTIRAAVVTQHVEFSGDIQGTSDATTWLRPEDLLPMKEESHTDVRSGGFRQESKYTATLKSLTPS